MKSAYYNRKPWLTSGLKKSIKEKNKLYYHSLKHPTISNRSLYRKYRNKLKNLLQASERQYYDGAFTRNKNDLNKCWCLIKEIIDRKRTSTSPNSFLIDNSLTSDKNKISNAFNKFFVNVGANLAKDLPDTGIDPISYLKKPSLASFFLSGTTSEEVETIINNLKKSSPGWDGLSSKIIKQSYQYYMQPLVHVLNLSLSQGIVPTQLKIARVTPIFKKGEITHLTNYRPVTVLPSISKTLERLARRDYIEEY